MADDFDPTAISWVLEEKTFRRLLIVLEEAGEVSFDLETTGIVEHGQGSKIVMISMTLPGGDTWVVPLFHPESPWSGQWRARATQVADALKGKDLIAQNGKFDCRWVYHHTGVDLAADLMWDTRVSSHLIDENETTSLKPRASATFGIERWDDFSLDKNGAALKVPMLTLGEYAARDTYWTWRLADLHREQMYLIRDEEDEPDEPITPEEIELARLGKLATWVAMPMMRTMSRVEQRGIVLDLEWVNDRIAEDTEVRDTTKVFMAERYGMDPEKATFAPTAHWFRAWTGRAVDAGDLRVAAMTPKGKPQWTRQVLTRQALGGSEVAEALLAHRKSVKRLEYLKAWRKYQRSDGAIHAHYNVGGIVTGRLSSSGPNMQQITKALRPAFVPSAGYVMADFDYSQIEMRVAAFIAQSEPMIQAFRDGADLHRMLAARITGKSEDEVTDKERQSGKAGNFGFLYGQSAYGFRFYAEDAYGISFNDKEAQRVYDSFFAQWDGMAQWHSRVLIQGHQTGQVSSPLGRVRRLPRLINGISNGAIKHAENAALNAPVQGMASDLMQIAAALIEGTMPGSEPVDGVRIVATVHDSLVVELEEGRWDELAKECLDRMINGVLDVMLRMGVDFNVPLAAECTVGTRWGLDDVGRI